MLWRFLDSHREWSTWREQRHVELTIASDSSGFAWGASVGELSVRDLWPPSDNRPIHLKQILFKPSNQCQMYF